MSSERGTSSVPQVDYLHQLSRQRSLEGRDELYRLVADLFERQDAVLSEDERTIMRDILVDLAKDVESAVRMSVARKMAENPSAPKELVLLLANDQIEVARPVLLRSNALRDADLIEIIRHRTDEHRLAVAARQNISEEASAALVETGNEDVIVTLLNNHSARIAETVMDYLAEESKRIGRFQEPLLKRVDLPPAVAKRMYTWVSAALRQYISKNFDVDLDDVDDALNDTVQELTEENQQEAQKPTPSSRLVDTVKAAGSLNEDFLVRALRQGRIPIFEVSMAALLDLERDLVRKLIYEPGWEKLAIACRAVDISPKTFQFIQQSVARIRSRKVTAAVEQDQDHQAFYQGIDKDAARRILRRWRRDSNLSDAIDEFSNL